MRTTLTIDDHLAERIEAHRRATGQSLKEAVNDLLGAGLEALQAARPDPFRIEPLDLGRPSRPLDGKLADLLDELDGPHPDVPLLVHDAD